MYQDLVMSSVCTFVSNRHMDYTRVQACIRSLPSVYVHSQKVSIESILPYMSQLDTYVHAYIRIVEEPDSKDLALFMWFWIPHQHSTLGSREAQATIRIDSPSYPLKPRTGECSLRIPRASGSGNSIQYTATWKTKHHT